MMILLKIISFMVRIFLAWIIGFFLYMIAMAMTVYDGFPSMIIQPIMGSIITGISIFLTIFIGSPLYIKRIWNWWEQFWWISVLLVVGGILFMFLSWSPFRITVIDYETNRPVETFHTTLVFFGWFGMLFGIIHCPLISIQYILKRFKGKVVSSNNKQSFNA